MTTYRSVIFVHEVASIRCGSRHRGYEDRFERAGCEVCELGHWFSLNIEIRQSAPGNAVVMEVATGDDILSGGGRNKEGQLRSLQYRLISGGMTGGEKGLYTEHDLTFSKYKKSILQRIDDLMCGTMEA